MPSIKLYDKYGIEIDHLTQWDMNVTLKIHDFPYDIAPVCHFATRYDKSAKTMTSTLEDNIVSVVVPNIFLKESKAINMYIFLYDIDSNSGRTIYVVNLPVEPKPKPDDYEYKDNSEVISLAGLKVRLEALIAQVEQTINYKIAELENSYENTILEIKSAIAADVENLNTQITNANTHLINEIRENNANLHDEITAAKNTLNGEIIDAVNSIILQIRDGSPKGVFATAADLVGKPSGIYLLSNPLSEDNGYIFFWDGENLSNRLLYYAGIVVNDGTITYAKLSQDLKHYYLGFVTSYTLLESEWDDGEQEVDVSDVYIATAHTKADVDFCTEVREQLLSDDCAGIYIVTNEYNDGKMIAHYIGNPPSADISVQLTLKEVP